ncbi:MAG: hypothetical protein J6N49_04255 [Alphaproteobacteria bacterium]|nr:hypothetical protein [Alphaproteobacteria bacterium]
MRFGEKQKPSFKIGQRKALFTIGNVKKIKDVLPIREHTDIKVSNKEDLREIVEEPCLKACQQLFEKNIQTVDSGCNSENCANRAYITINYDTLNKKNKEIADNLVRNGIINFIPKDENCIRNYYNKIEIEIPTNPEATVKSVENKLLAITGHFEQQQKIEKTTDLSILRTKGLIPDGRL